MNKTFLIIQKLLKASEFKKRLIRISSYSAFMKQERPIQYELVNLLDVANHKIWLEYVNTDIKCYNELIELKFFYEFDIVQLKKEISEISSMEQFKTNVESKKYSSSAIHAAIFKDLIKGPDIFLLIILSRNLKLIENNNEISERIKYFKKEFNAYKETGYCYCNEILLNVVTNFIEQSKKFLQLPLSSKENFSYYAIETHTLFPSTYHFYLFNLK